MRHFSSTPRVLIAMLALASLAAGCGQMGTSTPAGTSAMPMSGSSGSSGDSGASATDPAQGTTSDQSGTKNNSGLTPGSTPNSSVPTSDGSR